MTLNNSDEAAIEDRRSRAWELRLKGKTVRQIATELQVSVGTAHGDIAAVLERTKEENDDRAETHRTISLARLEKALGVVEQALDAQVFDELGNADNELRLKALDRMLKIEERRSKLLGLDAPTKVEAKVEGVSLEDLEVRRKLAAENESAPWKSQKAPSE